jgi:hypothetical protein
MEKNEKPTPVDWAGLFCVPLHHPGLLVERLNSDETCFCFCSVEAAEH